MGIAMGLDGAAMGTTMGLDGMAINEAATGLGGTAMDEAVGLDLSVVIVLAGARGQTRGITTGLPNCSGRTDKARQNSLTFVGIRTTQSGRRTERGTPDRRDGPTVA